MDLATKVLWPENTTCTDEPKDLKKILLGRSPGKSSLLVKHRSKAIKLKTLQKQAIARWTGWRPRHGETVLCWRSEQGRKEHNTRVCSIAWHCSKAMQWHTELAKTEFNFYTLKKKSDSGRGLLMQKFFFNMLWQQLENIEVRWLIQIWKALENTHVAMPENAGRKMPYTSRRPKKER